MLLFSTFYRGLLYSIAGASMPDVFTKLPESQRLGANAITYTNSAPLGQILQLG